MLAVVVPVLNCLKYTLQALESIPKEQGIQIIVIDNGSTDGTGAALRDLPLRYLYNPSNLGVSWAWNRGLKEAFWLGYERVLIMNNDVVLAPDTIPALLKWHARIGGIVSAHSVPALDFLARVDRRETFSPPCDYSCFVISKAIVDKVGWFNEEYWPAYFEDLDYDCRAEIAGIERGHAGDAVVCHFQSRTLHEGHLENHTENFEKNRQRFIRKWGDFIRGGRNAGRV